jgi:hypothetical protein
MEARGFLMMVPVMLAKESVISNCAWLRDVLSWKRASANDCRLGEHHSGIAGRDPPIRGIPL